VLEGKGLREREKDVIWGGLGFGFVSEHYNQRFERECVSVCDTKFEKDSQKRRDARKQREGRQSDAVEFESTTPRAFGVVT
jgi:hypothetical protein